MIAYTEITSINRMIYWIMFISLIVSGLVKVLLTKKKAEKDNKVFTDISMVLHILMIIFLALTREVYAIIVAFLLLIVKAMLLLRYMSKK